MHTILRRLLLLCAFLLYAHGAHAQESTCKIEHLAELPLTYLRHLPVVTVSVNGQAITFGIDTGAKNTALTPEGVQYLHLSRDPKHTTRVHTSNDTILVNNAIIQTLDFGGSIHENISAPVVSLVIKDIEKNTASGAPSLGGMIGADILSQYDIEYDAIGHKLGIYHVSGCSKLEPPWSGSFARVPATLTSEKRLIIPFKINGQELTSVFDTGSNTEKLMQSSAPKLGITPEMLAQDPVDSGSGGLGGHFASVPIHKIDSIEIAGRTFRNTHVVVIQHDKPDSDMLLGEDYMRSRRFWLSYSTGMVFLQQPAPNAKQH